MTSLRANLMGISTFTLLVINTLIWCIPLFFFTFIKVLLIPIQVSQKPLLKLVTKVCQQWAHGNKYIADFVGQMHWDVQLDAELDEQLSPNGSYLLLCNHRSWADIFVLLYLLNGRVPFPKFFLKQQLIWVPILGLAWWALEYPFMKRYSKEQLAKKPHLKGKDLETTRAACEKFKQSPVCVINYLEGTRFTPAKQQQQNSPYQHLLCPKAGGVALALSTMGDYFEHVIDVTIAYPDNLPPVTFWQLLSGNIPRISVRARLLTIPAQVVGRNYQEDKPFQQQMQNWVNDIWQHKDATIDALGTLESSIRDQA